MAELAQELSAMGNYFANSDYLTQDLTKGVIKNRAGAPMLALSDVFVVSLLNTLEAELGSSADGVIRAFGRDWGRRAIEQFVVEMGEYRHVPVNEFPLALFAADLTAAFQEHGWGRFKFDFSRYATGLICVEVADAFLGSVVKPDGRPIELLLTGFLAGMFTHLAGTELACLQTACRALGTTTSCFVITVPERLEAVAGWAELGKSNAEILAELASIRVKVQ